MQPTARCIIDNKIPDTEGARRIIRCLFIPLHEETLYQIKILRNVYLLFIRNVSFIKKKDIVLSLVIGAYRSEKEVCGYIPLKIDK